MCTFGIRNDSLVFLDQTAKFMRDVFFPTIKKEGVSHIINMGDTFDRRKFVNYNTLQCAHDSYFNPISQLRVQHDIIIGNHDTYYRSTSSLNCYDQFNLDSKIHRIHKVPHNETIGGRNFMFLPWINADNQSISNSSITNAQDDTVICSHLELAGFETQRGTVMEHGMNPDQFRRFDMVLSGHYHHKSSKDNIHYLGSPMQFTWADYEDRRGFHIMDTETGVLTFYENPAKMFVKIPYDDSNDKTIPVVTDDLAGKYVKIVVKNKTDHYLYDRFRESLEKMGIHNLSTYDEKIMIPIAEHVDVDSTQSTSHILSAYVDTIPDIDDDTRKTLAGLVENLYKEALDMEVV